jgi:hypothetical protein
MFVVDDVDSDIDIMKQGNTSEQGNVFPFCHVVVVGAEVICSMIRG